MSSAHVFHYLSLRVRECAAPLVDRTTADNTYERDITLESLLVRDSAVLMFGVVP